ASVSRAPHRHTRRRESGPRTGERLRHASSAAVVVVGEAADDDATRRAVRGAVARVAERRLRGTMRLPGAMGRARTHVAVGAPDPAARPWWVQQRAMASALRRLRHLRRRRPDRDPASLPRSAAAALPARGAADAVVPQQAARAPIDAEGAASRNPPPPE